MLRLPSVAWDVTSTSRRVNTIARITDMVSTTWRNRARFSVAHVDVFSGRAFLWAEAVCWTLRRAGRPYILTLHGGNLPDFARKHPRRMSRLLGSADAVTAPSGYLAERLRPYCSCVRLIPNAFDVREYDFTVRKKVEPNLVWLRTFHEQYNPSLAVEVLDALKDRFPHARLTMIGPDKGDGSFQSTRDRAGLLGVSDRCSFPGGVPKTDVPKWMNRGDIFLNTTNIDNTPVSVLEAMACGLCVVSTNVGGIPYLLKHEHDSLLVPPDDPPAMAAAVNRVLTEPGLAERLSRNAGEKARQFDWSVILPQWNAILNDVAAKCES